MSSKRIYHFSPEGVYFLINSLPEGIRALKNGGFLWLDLFNPSKEELYSLVDAIGVHPLSVEDCLDNSQVPKIEHFHDNTFILFNSYFYTGSELFIDEVDFFIGKNYLISVSGINSEDRKPLNGVEKLIEKDTGNTRKAPGYLLHAILDFVVDEKFKAVERLEDELENAEDLVIANPATFDPSELMRLRKNLLTLRKSLFHEREILVKICRTDCQFIQDKAIILYRDIYDHLAKFYELSETYREIVTSLMELYTSLLNNYMTRASNETNASVRRLTLIATIFMPLTLLAGIGGMSEWTMMTGQQNWKISYPLFLAGMGIIAALNYFLIHKLEKGDWKRKPGRKNLLKT
jgi:magnesium transporter